MRRRICSPTRDMNASPMGHFESADCTEPDSGEAEEDTDEDVEEGGVDLALFKLGDGIVHPGAEGGVSADEADGDAEADRIADDLAINGGEEEAEDETTGEVDDHRADGEGGIEFA